MKVSELSIKALIGPTISPVITVFWSPTSSNDAHLKSNDTSSRTQCEAFARTLFERPTCCANSLIYTPCLVLTRFAPLRVQWPNIIADKSFQDAITALNSLQSNFATIEKIRQSKEEKSRQSIPEMIEWLRRIGYQVCNLSLSMDESRLEIVLLIISSFPYK